MPLSVPGRLLRLVEQGGLHRDQVSADQRPEIAAEPLMEQQAQNRGMGDEVADAGVTTAGLRQRRGDVFTLMIRQSDVGERVSIAIEVVHRRIVSRLPSVRCQDASSSVYPEGCRIKTRASTVHPANP